MLPTVVVSTLRFTTYAELITSIWAVVVDPELVALPVPVPVPEAVDELAAAVRPEPVPVPLRSVPDAPEESSVSPTVRFIVATVPLIGAVKVASFKSFVAATTAA
jgi:hypothetical protein